MKYNVEQIQAIALSIRAERKSSCVVMIDADYPYTALCTFDDKGNAVIKATWGDCDSDKATELNKMPTAKNEAVERAVKNYRISEGAKDDYIEGTSPLMRASQIVVGYMKNGGTPLKNQLESVVNIMANENIAPTDTTVVITGNMSRYFPCRSLILEQLNPLAPYLPDKRFMFIADIKEHIANGLEIAKSMKKKVLASSVALKTVDVDGAVLTEYLAKAGESPETYEEPVFSGEFFAYPKDRVQIFIADENQSIAVPEGLVPEEGAMMRAALRFRDDNFYIVFKSDTKQAEVLSYIELVRGEDNDERDS